MKTKLVKIALNDFGYYLGREKGCLVVKDRENRVKRYALVEDEMAEIRIKSGNVVSAGALASCAWNGIPVLIQTRSGAPIAVLRSLLIDDSHVSTRISQYQAQQNFKGLQTAKEIVLAKVRGENELLRKYGLRQLDYVRCSEEVKAEQIARRLMTIEGKYTKQYFAQVFGLFSESLRPEGRKTYRAYSIVNNILNLGYSVLFWKLQLALMKAKLESYLGFLHSIQWGLPSLVCDFQELYRYLIDDFVIQYCRNIRNRELALKTEDSSGRKREFLKDPRDFMNSLDKYFETKVSVPRIRRGSKQELETLINEEALLFAQYLRNEKQTWVPRIVSLTE